jgi:hypothetical protein
VRTLLLAINLSFLIPFYYGQIASEHGFEFRQKLGFLAAHRGTLGHLPQESAKAMEFTYFIQTRDSKNWHQAYREPKVGVTLFVGSVGNNDLLGRYFGLSGFAELPMVKKNNFEWNWKMGFGLGYTAKTFDPIYNPKNNAVALKMNAMIVIGTKVNYNFGKNFLTVGLDLTHFSNAAFKVPNYGINLPYLSIGYGRTLSKEQALNSTIKSNLKQKKWMFGALGIFSMKEVNPIGTKRYPVYSMSLFARRIFSQKAGLELSLDIFSKQAIFGHEPLVPKTQLSIIQAALFAGYIVPFERFSFLFGAGAYVRDVYNPEGPVYFRIGSRYQFPKGILLNFTLKSHFGKADYMELGLGYTLNCKQK